MAVDGNNDGTKTRTRRSRGLEAPLAQEAARLGFPQELVQSLVRAGFIRPQSAEDGAVRFSFQDLVLLRSAQALAEDKVPVAAIRKALKKLRQDLPEGRPLSGVSLAADGQSVVIRDGDARWNAESGQGVMDFSGHIGPRSAEVAPVSQVPVLRLLPQKAATDVASIFQEACALEESQPERAMDRYRVVLHRAPDHADAHVNLGRLLQVRGQSKEAEGHYRTALALSPKDATAAFNLGTALEDQARWEDAIHAYAQAVAIDPHCADAHYNLACLYEKTGRKAQAIRHLISARAARPQ